MQTFSKLSPESQPTAVALGFFDGVHRGHRRVLGGAARQRENGLLPVCLTFSQSPKSFFSPAPVPLLMNRGDKLKALESVGMEHVYLADFRELMHQSAKDFFQTVLVDTLKVKSLFCGFNYRFGRHAAGDAAMLKSLCDAFDVALTVVPPETDGGEVVCSTLIKRLISEGQIRRANDLLGARFGFCAPIRHGNHLGHTLGAPTINQLPDAELISPKYGVYVSEVTLQSGARCFGVTNVGVKPTVGGTTPLWETWMPQYRGGEIYGEAADVRLLDFIREERRFDSLDALKAEIIQNSETALNIYTKLSTGSL